MPVEPEPPTPTPARPEPQPAAQSQTHSASPPSPQKRPLPERNPEWIALSETAQGKSETVPNVVHPEPGQEGEK